MSASNIFKTVIPPLNKECYSIVYTIFTIKYVQTNKECANGTVVNQKIV